MVYWMRKDCCRGMLEGIWLQSEGWGLRYDGEDYWRYALARNKGHVGTTVLDS